jgi:hypothetical protein
MRGGIERDRFLTAIEAREYGLIDELLTTRKLARHPGQVKPTGLDPREAGIL